MTRSQQKIAQYLDEAHAMELALVRTLQAHSAMTPAGPYRAALDRHLRETRDQADRIERRLREIGQGRGIVDLGYGIAQRLVGQVLSLAKAPLDVTRGMSAEEKLLKNAKDECATEALEIATYDALEQLARQAGDEVTARLAADHRADEERMLETLREQIPALTAAVVGAEVLGDPSYDVRRTGAAKMIGATVREATRSVDDTARDVARAARGATGTTSATQEREEHRSPLPRYDELTVEDVTNKLERLTPAQLRHVATYERAHKRRRGVLEAVERRRQDANGNGADSRREPAHAGR
jgi:ferritin-like metal-binding protein YciE